MNGMKDSVALAKVEMVGKSVQEVVKNCENNVPKNYIYEEGGVGFKNALLPSDIPVIDLQRLTSPSSTAQEELAKLHSGLTSWGCFRIMSNGIFRSSINRVVTNAEKERFTLAMFFSPDSEKEIKPIDKLVNESRPILYKPVKNYVDAFFEN